MVRIVDRGLSAAEAAAVAAWRYPVPYDLYDNDDADVLLFPEYRPVYDGDEFVGFVCFGEQARVRGQQEREGALDVGAGLRPDRVGQGLGSALLPVLVEYARRRFRPQRLRVAVAAFNLRSLRACRSAGFVEVRRFAGPGERDFVELELAAC